MNQNFTRIVRIKEVISIIGLSRSTIFNRIEAGLLPPSINLGEGRAVGWLESEIQTVLNAFVSGMKPDAIKEVVKGLVETRKTQGGF